MARGATLVPTSQGLGFDSSHHGNRESEEIIFISMNDLIQLPFLFTPEEYVGD
jgi:hypothetical protein